ncbi:MAG TPA: HAMP domain-containing sensor histidine kinase [Clostridiaceae bacterium]|nr:HAMP domain-containing sensor histidine kinase [Clostridiaceae bacterium]
MKKRKHRILLGYAIIFCVFILGFTLSIFTFVSRTHLDKIDTDLELFRTAVIRVSGRNLEMNIPFNPKMVIILRDDEGRFDPRFPVPDYIRSNIENLTPSVNDEVQTVAAGSFRYRALKFDTILEEEMHNVQVLYNIDAELNVLNNLKKILINGSIVILFLALVISNFMADLAIRPLQESLEKQREFLENASHELRTPITIIQSRLEGLLRDPEKKIIDKYEYIEPAIRETRRMSKMVSNLMVLTRADAGEAMGDVEQFNLAVLGEEIAEIYREFASFQEKPFTYYHHQEVLVKANREKIHQLLIILLDNALKYTGKGERLELRIENQKEKALIRVSDEGIGIKEENLDNVFMRFFREDKARTRTTGGTGLGLSIAKWITESHGGTIRAYKNRVKGTVIEVHIPKEYVARKREEI